MTDNRKVLESIPEPASLDRTMPAPRELAEKGKNIGGITQTAESALRGGEYAAGGSTAGASTNQQASAGKPASTSAKPVDRSDRADDEAAIAADAKTPDDESALDSLGRAIGAPLSGEAAAKEPRR